MDINEAKQFFIVISFLCFIVTSISFYNFTINRVEIKSQHHKEHNDILNKITYEIDDIIQKQVNNDIIQKQLNDDIIQKQLNDYTD